MPPSAGDPRLRVALRVLGIAAAFGLGAVAACLIAFGSSTRLIQLGVIAGLWSALLGAITIYGAGHHHVPALPAGNVHAGGEPELPTSGVLECEQDAAAPRRDEQQLPDVVRRELAKIQQALSEQLALVSAEVTALRGEFVEKVAGRARLERTETMRVIGSDIAGLQHEVRRLAFARESLLNGDHDVVPGREVSAAVAAPGYIPASRPAVVSTVAPAQAAAAPVAPPADPPGAHTATTSTNPDLVPGC